MSTAPEFAAAVTVEELDQGPRAVVGAGVVDTVLALARARDAWCAVLGPCTHAECPLWNGWVEGDALRCPCHGSLFELASGSVREGPADEPLRTHPTRVVDGRVAVEV